jgi:hypothetical protein
VNKKGQFSIIAALLVAVILIATVVVTYSAIRNSTIADQPQILSAIDETNLAIKQILGFTIGYYGSVLQVTGNSSYARILALEYLRGGLANIANMHPQWGTSFDVSHSDLWTYWFTNRSFSTGNLAVTYNLTGLGIRGITYETSCRLDANIANSKNGQAFLSIRKDQKEPLVNLGKQNFKFYRYETASSKWTQISPSNEPLSYANGTYQIDIPSGVDPYSYVIQVEDQRGIIVVTSSFSRYTCTPTWSGITASGTSYVDNGISDVDSSPSTGTHSSFAGEQNFDGIFDTLTETRTDFRVKKGTFLKATATGSQIVTGVGFQPKAVVFWWTRQMSYGESAGIYAGYGFATNDGGNCGVAYASDDNLASSNTGRQRSTTYSIIILSSGNPTMSAQASVTSFNVDGFTLNWQTNEPRADIVQYIALGGMDLNNAKASSFALTTTSGNQDVTGVGFQPDFAMFLWAFTPASGSHAEIGLGFAASSTKRGALVADSEDGRSPMDTWKQQRTDSCILLLDPTSGAQDAVVDFNQFLSDGFRLSKSDPPASSTSIFYLALKGGYYDVGSFNSPTLTGTQNITSVGFQPKLVMLATQGRSATTAIGPTSELSFGAATSATETGATWFEDPTGLASSDNEMETLNTKIVQWRDRTSPNVFTLRGSADFVSFLPNGFRVSWSNVETVARQVVYVAFGGHDYELDLEAQWTNANYNGTTKELAIYANSNSTENLRVDVWHGGSWLNLFTNLVNGWNNASVLPYLDSQTFTIRFKDSNQVGDMIQNSWRIDATLLRVLPPQGLYSSQQDLTIVTELLQNGTMRWLGQNLQLTTLEKPIPPIPVRTIHVNQTVNGANREVPFQIEDWASDYRIPLGLTNNASVFNSRTILVFLINSKVSKITIWWNGSDTATQTPYAYTNKYFTKDNPSSRLLNNTKLVLQFSGEFTLTSTVGTSSCTANFMRINNKASTYGAREAYVIHHGIVRDIVHQESEWSNGVDNCPNLYAHVVLTLPANATYYTYQLRLMFVESQQSRSITDLCPIKLTASTGQPQTENGTASGYPIISAATGTFYNYSTSRWEHHWSQMTTGTKGAGIMFGNSANRELYIFDSVAGSKTGALKVDGGTKTIELLPVTRFPVGFTSALDVSWIGAVVTFDGSTPICGLESGKQTGFWITVEYPPTMTVTTGS